MSIEYIKAAVGERLKFARSFPGVTIEGGPSEPWEGGDVCVVVEAQGDEVYRVRNTRTGHVALFDGLGAVWFKPLPPPEHPEEGLRVGEVVRDPGKLKPGMRVRWACWVFELKARDEHANHWNYTPARYWHVDRPADPHADGELHHETIRRDGVTFLGYADTAEKPQPAAGTFTAEGQFQATYALRACTCAANESCVACVFAPAAEPPKPAPAPLPFVRHWRCSEDHDKPVLCLSCEAIIATTTDARDATRPPPTPSPQKHPHEPPSSGRGGMVGGIWNGRAPR